MNEDVAKAAKESITTVGEIIKLAGDDPQVKEAASNLGKTAVTLTKTINNCLVPLAAINFAFDKARVYFSNKFEGEISAKANAIPTEHLVEPKASIAGPTLQALAFTHEEEKLKEMYLNLLSTAMDGRVSGNAHPSFVEIIKQLDSQDAAYLKIFLVLIAPLGIVRINSRSGDNEGYNVVYSNLVDLTNGGKPLEDKTIPARIDNWIRLGLIEVDYQSHLVAPTSYDWVLNRPEYLSTKAALEERGFTVDLTNGILSSTTFGKQFSRAVGILT